MRFREDMLNENRTHFLGRNSIYILDKSLLVVVFLFRKLNVQTLRPSFYLLLYSMIGLQIQSAALPWLDLEQCNLPLYIFLDVRSHLSSVMLESYPDGRGAACGQMQLRPAARPQAADM